MDIQQFLQQLALGLNQLEVKGQNNVLLLSFLMNLVNEYANGLVKTDKQ